MDHILWRRSNLREIGDFKVVTGESVAEHHEMVVWRTTLVMRTTKRVNVEQKIKRWKLKKEDCFEAFRERLTLALGGHEELPDDRVTIATVIRETSREEFGV